jgi:hypothetical protein
LDFDIVKNSNDGMIVFHKSKKSKLKSFSEKIILENLVLILLSKNLNKVILNTFSVSPKNL